MELTIITPKGIRCQLQVDKASFPGSRGAFTILANHAPLVSTLNKGNISYCLKGKEEDQEIAISEGVVEVRQNKIRIFTE